MSPATVAVLVVGAAAAGVVILALASARPGPAPPPYPDYLRRWRELHGLEPDRMTGGFIDRYYRLPYAVARPLAARGVSPNVLTLLGLVVAGASVPCYLAGGSWPALAALAVLLSGLCDQLDGAVAVLTGRASAFGAIWDSAVDRLTDVVLLAGPAAWLVRSVGGTTATAGLLGLVTAGGALFLLESVRARCQAVGFVDHQVVTPAERPTRVVVAAVLALLAGAVAAYGDQRSAGLVWAWGAWGLAALTVVSVGMLLRDAARRAQGSGAVGG